MFNSHHFYTLSQDDGRVLCYNYTLYYLVSVHPYVHPGQARPLGYKKISCSTQLSMNFFLLINVKMPTIVCSLTFMSRKNSILGLQKAELLDIFTL